MNRTHDMLARSFVESANEPGCDFPIQNLPYGVVVRPEFPNERRIAVAIGDQILDLRAAVDAGLFAKLSIGIRAALALENLNGLMSLGAPAWSTLRSSIFELLCEGSELSKDRAAQAAVLCAMKAVELKIPVLIRNYTDFYSSIYHARNVGKLFRPDSPLLPNYKHVPIAYHGRASSIVLSGTQIKRPTGQVQRGEGESPQFISSAAVDYELELGLFVGPGNSLGSPITLAHAREHMFGFCLLNDWSARDIQRWEYQPLGPFLAKSFASSISPWVVTIEALEPFRSAAYIRDRGDPQPLPYLFDQEDQSRGAFSITLEVEIRAAGSSASQRLSRVNSNQLYWTPAQWVTHHTSNGCNLLPGDLLGSGTISGGTSDSLGCLTEITEGGKKLLALDSGVARTYLEDGDEIIMRAYAEKPGVRRIGFGSLCGQIAGS